MGRHHQSLKKIACFLFAFAAVAFRSTANPVTVSYLDQYFPPGVYAYGALNFDPSDLAEGALPGSYIQFYGSFSDSYVIPEGAPVTLAYRSGYVFPLVELFNVNSLNRVGFGAGGSPLYDQLTTETGTIGGEQLLDVSTPFTLPTTLAGGFWVGYNPPAAVPDNATAGGLLFGSLAVLAAAKRRIRPERAGA